jgi:hypothetical protein
MLKLAVTGNLSAAQLPAGSSHGVTKARGISNLRNMVFMAVACEVIGEMRWRWGPWVQATRCALARNRGNQPAGETSNDKPYSAPAQPMMVGPDGVSRWYDSSSPR